jgi:hypothetical protein
MPLGALFLRRTDGRKKSFLSAPDHGEGAVPPPFEPLKDGFATGGRLIGKAKKSDRIHLI